MFSFARVGTFLNNSDTLSCDNGSITRFVSAMNNLECPSPLLIPARKNTNYNVYAIYDMISSDECTLGFFLLNPEEEFINFDKYEKLCRFRFPLNDPLTIVSSDEFGAASECEPNIHPDAQYLIHDILSHKEEAGVSQELCDYLIDFSCGRMDKNQIIEQPIPTFDVITGSEIMAYCRFHNIPLDFHLNVKGIRGSHFPSTVIDYATTGSAMGMLKHGVCVSPDSNIISVYTFGEAICFILDGTLQSEFDNDLTELERAWETFNA